MVDSLVLHPHQHRREIYREAVAAMYSFVTFLAVHILAGMQLPHGTLVQLPLL